MGHLDRRATITAAILLTCLAWPAVALAQADPIILVSKKTSSDSVRLSWSVGSAPFRVLRRTTANPALGADLVLQDGFVLSAYDDVAALSDSTLPMLFYTVTAAPGPDTTPPVISITSPADGTSISTNTPTVTITYSDPLALVTSSGVDLSSLHIPIDDVDRSNSFTRDSTGAAFTFAAGAPLADGLHTIVATVQDVVGNKGNASSVSFSVNGPIIQSLSPANGLIGASIQIIGQGFSATPANNVVVFDGVPATVTGATTTILTVTVPTGAVSGAVSVTRSILKSNEVPFTVEAVNGFTRVNNIWYNATNDLVVVDRLADRVYCVPNGTTTKNILDSTVRPVGLGVTDTQTLFISASTTTTGPILTINNCTAGSTLFRNVQDAQGFTGTSFALAHRKGASGGETAVYVAYQESQTLGITRLIFQMPDAGSRQQTPATYTFPVSFTLVTGMEFDSSNNLFITNGSTIYYVPNGGTAADVRTIMSALFNQPAGMTFDDRGNLYVACQGNGTIVRVRPSFTGAGGTFDGTISLIASGYASGASGVRALAFQRIAGRGVLSIAEATRVFSLRLNDVDVIEVEFSHGASGSSVNVRHNGTTDILTPEWSQLAVPRNEPVVLVQGQSLSLQARFRSSPAVTSAKIRATGSIAGFDFGEQTVAFTNGDSGLVTFNAVSTVPILAPTTFGLELQWKIHDVNGSGSTEVNINPSGKHPIYIVFATPTFPMDRNTSTSEPWFDEVIEKAITYSRGSSSQTDALVAIAKNLYDAHEFDYNSDCRIPLNAGGFFHLTELLNGHNVDCSGISGYFIILARSIGITSSKVQIQQCGIPRFVPAWDTSPIRLTYRISRGCGVETFVFHQFPYDVPNASVHEPLFKVACTGGSGTDGALPLNMPLATYKSYLNPSGIYNDPCNLVGDIGSVE